MVENGGEWMMVDIQIVVDIPHLLSFPVQKMKSFANCLMLFQPGCSLHSRDLNPRSERHTRLKLGVTLDLAVTAQGFAIAWDRMCGKSKEATSALRPFRWMAPS
jgi:hypothetical protein